ncbi:GroES-like protein [Patellaria atrata CBS 101060]|uniref:GroES-like protein n=1 Tax=Patellaria atrata CBS 101060 TaxID=1346257 RepID=A0A9P4VU04_9PEZI|nr:GroES-like protein [Patellaria atrata CBS 101060]
MVSFTVFKGSEDGSIVKSTVTKDLSGDLVLIRITASGLCGTDVHYRTSGIALGHEGAGVVEDVGPAVKTLKKGDRVGWGYLQETCGMCQQCLSGRETYCLQRKMYGDANTDQGSFGSHGVWREPYIFKIPDALSDVNAAPLMCGGATVFNALYTYDVKPTSRVGVVGVGGLGHLAIEFAAKAGCDVVVFSGTDSKKDEATKLGAKEFYAMKGKKEVDIGHKLDYLIVTTSELPDWSIYLPLLAPGATIFPLSVSGDNISVPSLPFIQSGITLQGTIVAARHVHNQMLDFAARNDIKPMTQTFPMNERGITDAFDVLNSGKMRYRGVLVVDKA